MTAPDRPGGNRIAVAVHPLVWAAAATIITIGVILWTIGAPWSTVAVGIIAAGTVVGAAILGEDA